MHMFNNANIICVCRDVHHLFSLGKCMRTIVPSSFIHLWYQPLGKRLTFMAHILVIYPIPVMLVFIGKLSLSSLRSLQEMCTQASSPGLHLCSLAGAGTLGLCTASGSSSSLGNAASGRPGGSGCYVY